jgi:hypothetical protein
MRRRASYLAIQLSAAAMGGCAPSIGASYQPAQAQASAQPGCDTRANVKGHLERKYGETLRAVGLTNNGGVLEVYVAKSGSWTMVFVAPHGTACMVAAGESFETLPAVAPGLGS